MIEVVYMINATGIHVTKRFYTEHEAKKLWNRLHYSKKCTPVSYMVYD